MVQQENGGDTVVSNESRTPLDLLWKEGYFEKDYFDFNFENGNFKKVARNLFF